MAGGKRPPTMLGIPLPDDLVTREQVRLRRQHQRWMRAGLAIALAGIVLSVLLGVYGIVFSAFCSGSMPSSFSSMEWLR